MPHRAAVNTAINKPVTGEQQDRAPDDAPPPLVIDGVTVRLAGQDVLQGIDLGARAASLVGILGPNGGGKTTLLRACAGLVPVDAGRVRLFGLTPRAARGRFAYMPQQRSDNRDFPATALDVVLMGLYPRIGWFGRIRRHHRDEARAWLDHVGLGDRAASALGALSTGQQQRVLLARALAQRARLILLDEPLAGVDPGSAETIIERLKAERDAGATILLVHHALDMAARHFDEAVMLNGRIIASGPATQTATQAVYRQALRMAGS